jgi:hypothetical protein
MASNERSDDGLDRAAHPDEEKIARLEEYRACSVAAGDVS